MEPLTPDERDRAIRADLEDILRAGRRRGLRGVLEYLRDVLFGLATLLVIAWAIVTWFFGNSRSGVDDSPGWSNDTAIGREMNLAGGALLLLWVFTLAWRLRRRQ